MKLVIQDVLSAASLLEQAASVLSISNALGNYSGSVAYSTVSGFDQAGQMHGSISAVSLSDAGFWYRCSGDPVLPCSG